MTSSTWIRDRRCLRSVGTIVMRSQPKLDQDEEDLDVDEAQELVDELSLSWDLRGDYALAMAGWWYPVQRA